jgi:hypothetical protein
MWKSPAISLFRLRALVKTKIAASTARWWWPWQEREGEPMDKIPFSVYDFFAYLSSGAVLMVAIDYVWNLGLCFAKSGL